MKKYFLLPVLLVSFYGVAYAQDSTAMPGKAWNFVADANLYFFPGEFILLPVFRADKNRLHLEARYNYEDLETFSGWVGYNFNGGKKLEYTITPMVGGVVGVANGVAAGLEFRFAYKRFELSSEQEYLFDTNAKENSFFYAWTDFTYSPKDWLWVGLSGQRTQLYETDLEIQRGFLVGGGFKGWELTGYLYNLGFDNPFLLIAVSANF
ncbi:MAG: hypothetical protein OEV74_07655 [Cyclobacteriaceae bacterium]|jgi:hypothetical protein|nr:hypothetical protein [Cyclobacteriaceae bacterium]MDH4296134.1 hypothetical protein [Cyclobacteriaceae bacterium]MDH5248335.1 hypothetical protein [Cyclobacteriaceae bacterium]